VGNTPNFTQPDWATNIGLAQTAHIDAFALNMAAGDTTNAIQVPLAFAAAEAKGFSLFFSFDYAGNGVWNETDVIAMLNAHIGSSAYYHVGGKPFVSSFLFFLSYRLVRLPQRWLQKFLLERKLTFEKVSTFEGPTKVADWTAIKAATNCLFYPDYSSLGAKKALLAGGGGIVDGLFSWAAWPWGNTNMVRYYFDLS
jgi:hypothetical protein